MASIKEAKKIAETSGNAFHCRVVADLKARGCATVLSPYYVDAATSKPRELDVVAERVWHFRNSWHTDQNGLVVFRLFVECKYVKDTTVFWFADRRDDMTLDWLDANTRVGRRSGEEDKHHYRTSGTQVAKLFASANDRRTENESIFRAVNQTLNAIVSIRSTDLMHPDTRRSYPIQEQTNLPVIVCSTFDHFYSTSVDAPDTEPQPISTNFQLEVNYAYADPSGGQRNEYFLVDIVEYKQLSAFFESLEVDKQAVFDVLEFPE